MLIEGPKLLTDDVRGRVSFKQHNFFEPQPPIGAAAFILRQCTHNWCDGDVVNMFKAFIPALEASGPDTPLLINDYILPGLGAWPRHREREVRQMDMTMLISCGSKDRTEAELAALLKEADPRYEIRSAYVHPDEPMGLLEVYLRR